MNEAAYIARYGRSAVAHAIRDGWSYSSIDNARTLCGRHGPFAVEHYTSGKPIPVTCARCSRMTGRK